LIGEILTNELEENENASNKGHAASGHSCVNSSTFLVNEAADE